MLFFQTSVPHDICAQYKANAQLAFVVILPGGSFVLAVYIERLYRKDPRELAKDFRVFSKVLEQACKCHFKEYLTNS